MHACMHAHAHLERKLHTIAIPITFIEFVTVEIRSGTYVGGLSVSSGNGHYAHTYIISPVLLSFLPTHTHTHTHTQVSLSSGRLGLTRIH